MLSKMTDSLDVLWEQIKRFPQSPSHDREHLERVLAFARELQQRYGGDLEVVSAAALLHDIGRVDVRLPSAESAQAAADKAAIILQRVGFPRDKIEQVCGAIRQHDQENLIPDSIEGKILKEADFLAGFGAWGILRVAMFQGERGSSVDDVINRLRDKMPGRIASLQFPESRLLAEQEYRFVTYFLSLLNEPPSLPKPCLPGQYIAFEGISGSGKDTQIALLHQHIAAMGKEAVFVIEPSDRFRLLLRQADTAAEELFMLLADRSRMAQDIIMPSLKTGKVVVASRCYISSLVYQATAGDAAYIHFLHRFLPVPDRIILLDISAECADARLRARRRETGEQPGKFEVLQRLKCHRQRYLEVIQEFEQGVVIDGMSVKEQIAEQIWQSVKPLLT